jgi:hypothetical protein
MKIINLIYIICCTSILEAAEAAKYQELMKIVVNEDSAFDSKEMKEKILRTSSAEFSNEDYMKAIHASFINKDELVFCNLMYHLSRRKALEKKYRKAIESLLEFSLKGKDKLPVESFLNKKGFEDINLKAISSSSVELWSLIVLQNFKGEQSESLARLAMKSKHDEVVEAAIVTLSKYNIKDLNLVMKEFISQKDTKQLKQEFEQSLYYAEEAAKGTLNKYTKNYPPY